MFTDNTEIIFTHAEHAKTNATVYERDDLLSYGAVVLYDMPKTITDAQKAKFLSLFEAFENASYRRLVAQSIRWAAGAATGK